jgi:hypothetical protein
LSYETQRKLLAKYIKFGMVNGELAITEMDIFNLQHSVLRAAGVPVDTMKEEYGDKIYNKYFGDLIKGIKADTEKNSEKTSE